MVFIELTTDAFEDTVRQAVTDAGRRRRAGTSRARRPLRGLEIKDDTYAVLRVIAADGGEIPLLDSSSESGQSSTYTNFILQSVSEARMEKQQIVDTFGEPYIFFFGEAPRFIDVRAIVLNSFDFNWSAEFWANYNLYFRGTKLVEMGARVYLFYDDVVVEGYMLLAQAQAVSELPLSIELSFRLFVTSYSNISFVGNANYPVRAAVNLPPDVSLTTADAFDVGKAAVKASIASAMNDAAANQAALGQAQQANGTGGGGKLSDALRSGLLAASDMSGIAQNALEALFGTAGGAGVRHLPLRGRIADNLDEYTAPLPPDTDGQGTEESGLAEAPGDLPTTVSTLAAPWGANLNNPNAQRQLGLGPTFLGGAGAGFFLGAGAIGGAFGAVAGATFGASAVLAAGASVGAFAQAGAGNAVTGTSALGGAASPSRNGALALGAPGAWRTPGGFVQGFAAGAGYVGAVGSAGLGAAAWPAPRPNSGVPTANQLAQVNFLGTPPGFGWPGKANVPPYGSPGYGTAGYPSSSYGAAAYAGVPTGVSGPAYVGGVQVGGGVVGGVGIGGGIAGRAAHPFGAFTGATSFPSTAANLQGQGASVLVTGTPTCFATIAVSGTLAQAASGRR